MDNLKSESDASITIPEFYKGKNVLLTGVTGFIGQLILEKLLRTCPDTSGIYLLVRPKKGLEPDQRLEKLLAGEVFTKAKLVNPDYAKKMKIIEGDVRKADLGLSENDRNMLIEKINVIIHSAATVRFDALLRDAVEINILGTRGTINLAKKMEKLVAHIHVSTAFAFCPRRELEEKLYETPYHYQEVIDLLEKDDATLEKMWPKLKGKWPNTYTFTKALAEQLVFEERGSLPIAIVRPSIVSSTWREPIPGWSNNLNGPIGITVGSSVGVLRSALVPKTAKHNVIPADVVVNIILATSWYISTRKHTPECMIFHATVEDNLGTCINDTVKWCAPTAITYPSEKVFRYPGGSTKGNYYLNKIAQFLDHTVPAALVDAMCWLAGKEMRMLKVYKTVHNFLNVNQYFLIREWHFDKTNTFTLERALSESDRKTFFIDMSEMHPPTYWQTALINTRKYILRENFSTLPNARTRLRWLHVVSWIEKSLKGALLGYFVYCVLYRSTLFAPIWDETVSTLNKVVLGSDEES